jgi:hypothetical protein
MSAKIKGNPQRGFRIHFGGAVIQFTFTSLTSSCALRCGGTGSLAENRSPWT